MTDADAFNAFEVAGWERQVAGYEDFFVPITARLAVPLLEATAVGEGTRVLDVATGPGHIAAAAAERGASVVGADVAEGMLALARRLHPQLEFVYGDAEDLPFEDGSFDAVIAGFVLLHLGRPEQAAAEFARVLRPGGRVALAMWDTPDRSRLPGVLVQAIADAGAAPPPDLPPGPPIFRFSEEAELRGLLGALEDVEVETVSFLHRVPVGGRAVGRPARRHRAPLGAHPAPARGDAAADPRGLRSARPGLRGRRGRGDPDLRQARVGEQAGHGRRPRQRSDVNAAPPSSSRPAAAKPALTSRFSFLVPMREPSVS